MKVSKTENVDRYILAHQKHKEFLQSNPAHLPYSTAWFKSHGIKVPTSPEECDERVREVNGRVST